MCLRTASCWCGARLWIMAARLYTPLTTKTTCRKKALLLVTLVLSTLAVHPFAPGQGVASTPIEGRFASEIRAFLKEDSLAPPPKHAILFVGSSIFRLWDHLKEDMAPLPVFNRAFGGSQTSDLLDRMDRIVFPYEPEIIVYYCGSNDVNAGRGADSIFLGFKRFAERAAERLPGTKIFYVSINRAPQKKERWNIVDSANTLARTYCERTPNRWFVDVNPVLFDASGNPRVDYYQADMLHLREQAYVGFAAAIKPLLEQTWKSR
jgi:lysophospholipase L1-like esterase